jgi:hypothetical protein
LLFGEAAALRDFFVASATRRARAFFFRWRFRRRIFCELLLSNLPIAWPSTTSARSFARREIAQAAPAGLPLPILP